MRQAMMLPRFHPATVIRELGPGEQPYTIADALCHLGVLGSTGSGKTSGAGRFFSRWDISAAPPRWG